MPLAHVASVPMSQVRVKHKTSALRQHEIRWGYLFLSPWIIGFLLFSLLPILMTIFLSFTDYKGTTEFAPGNFNMIGLANYAHLFDDPYALPSMGVTLKFALIGIPLGLIIPLLFALLVNSKYLFGANFFRTFFFLPTVIPVVAGTIIFGGVLNA
ncbi:MAG TPA: sugar ABC transporter permease [Anaerolineae bacterium]